MLKFYDGDTGKEYQVTEFIDDGKIDIVIDEDELALIRWAGEGGFIEKDTLDNIRPIIRKAQKEPLVLFQQDENRKRYRINPDLNYDPYR